MFPTHDLVESPDEGTNASQRESVFSLITSEAPIIRIKRMEILKLGEFSAKKYKNKIVELVIARDSFITAEKKISWKFVITKKWYFQVANDDGENFPKWCNKLREMGFLAKCRLGFYLHLWNKNALLMDTLSVTYKQTLHYITSRRQRHKRIIRLLWHFENVFFSRKCFHFF